jgi:UDP-N-acetylmuramoylalanine--D-glutamate ligase
MIPVPSLAGKNVMVMGLGKSGTATARALAASGAVVTAWDDNEAARDAARAEGMTVAEPADLAGIDLLVWSPGIPHTHPADKAHPLAARARAAGIPVACDVELLARAKPANPILTVTGTNGKSTTATLLTHVLRQAGREVAAGGNLGTAALDLPDLGPEGRYVLELSSYQLELVDSLRARAGVLLNITPDHLGRHGGMDGYVAAKRRLFALLASGGTAVIGTDDDYCETMAFDLEDAGLNVVRISAEQTLQRGVSAADGILRLDGVPQADLRQIDRLPGRHNWQNACAAFALALADGVPAETAAAALGTYPGLAHRQELVAVVDGVAFINDSKATNADATEKALACYDNIHWILGGQPKEGGIDSLVPHFGRVKRAYLIGEAAPAFAKVLKGHVPFTDCGEMLTAVTAARARAEAGDVVLLSPACASWDQFKSFEHRGDVFRQLVERQK